MAIRALVDFLYEEKYAAKRELDKLAIETGALNIEDSENQSEEATWRAHFQLLDRHELVSAVRYRGDIIDRTINLALNVAESRGATDHDGQGS